MEDKKTIKTRNLTRFPKLSVKIKSIMINYVGEGLETRRQLQELFMVAN